MDELVTHFAYELMTEKEKELEEAKMKRKIEEEKKLKLELKIDKIENLMRDILENSRKFNQYIERKIKKKEMREQKKEEFDH